MREILFRGRQFDSNTWIEGYLVEDVIIAKGSLDVDEDYIGVNGEWSSVILDTVGQFTGLLDKNGKKIFENDRVIMHYFYGTHNQSDMGYVEAECELIGIVGLDELGWYTLVATDKLYWVNYLQEPSEELEIIGNIHDTEVQP